MTLLVCVDLTVQCCDLWDLLGEGHMSKMIGAAGAVFSSFRRLIYPGTSRTLSEALVNPEGSGCCWGCGQCQVRVALGLCSLSISAHWAGPALQFWVYTVMKVNPYSVWRSLDQVFTQGCCLPPVGMRLTECRVLCLYPTNNQEAWGT